MTPSVGNVRLYTRRSPSRIKPRLTSATRSKSSALHSRLDFTRAYIRSKITHSIRKDRFGGGCSRAHSSSFHSACSVPSRTPCSYRASVSAAFGARHPLKMWSWNVCAAPRRKGLPRKSGSSVAGDRSSSKAELSFVLDPGGSCGGGSLAGCVGSSAGWYVENAVGGRSAHSSSCESGDRFR